MTIVFNYPTQSVGDSVYTDTAGALRAYNFLCAIDIVNTQSSALTSVSGICISSSSYVCNCAFYVSKAMHGIYTTCPFFHQINMNYATISTMFVCVNDTSCTQCSCGNYTGYLNMFPTGLFCYAGGDNFRIRIFGTFQTSSSGNQSEASYAFFSNVGCNSTTIWNLTCCMCIDIIKSGGTCWTEVCYGASCVCYSGCNVPFCIYVATRCQHTGTANRCVYISYIPNCIEKISGTVKWLCCF